MGSLSKKARTSLVAILYSLVTNNYENLVYEFLDVAEYESIPDDEALQRDIADALAPHLGLGVQDMDVTSLVNSIVGTLSKHEIYLPRDWFIIFRSLMTLDGVGKSINIDLNIFELIDEQIHDVMSELVTKESIMEDAVWIGRDALNSVRVIPRHIKWMLKELSRKKYAIDLSIKGVENKIENLSNSIFFMGLIFLSSVFIFSGVFLLSGQYIGDISSVPNICWILWAFGMITMFRAALFVKK
jgi:ubiquinone biosynthesis protein